MDTYFVTPSLFSLGLILSPSTFVIELWCLWNHLWWFVSGIKYFIIGQITLSTIGDLHNVLVAHLDVFSLPSQSVLVESLLKLLQTFLKLDIYFWVVQQPNVYLVLQYKIFKGPLYISLIARI